MPESASAVVLERPRRLVLREIPLPDIGDDDALVRVVPGHETVGIIETIGPRAAQRLMPDMVVMAGERDAVPPVHGVVVP